MATLLLVVVVALAPGASGAPSASGTWRVLSPAPVAPTEGLTSVWTGTKMLVFGNAVSRAKDGAVLGRVPVAAAYDPAADAWSKVQPPSRASSSLGYDAVWTGSEMLVWGQGTHEAFNPRTNRWRGFPGSRLLAIHDLHALVVWTGRDLIGWGGGCCGDAFSDGVAFNPATKRWRALPRAPLAGSQNPVGAWTGRELVVFVGGLDPDGKPWPARLARAAAYDPIANTWRRIAPLRGDVRGATAAWDGREVLVVGGARSRSAFAYDPAKNHWHTLARMPSPRTGATAVWTGKRLLLWGGETGTAGAAAPKLPRTGLAYEPRANRWSVLPAAPLVGRLGATAVWTRHALIVWGGNRPATPLGSGTKYLSDGAIFTPALR